MSGTRSHSPKEPAIKRSALLVSHGQPSEPDIADAEMVELRNRVATLLPDWAITSATLAKSGSVEAALETVGSEPFVFPVFMTDGWFTQTALPARFEGVHARFLRPLGVDPALPALAANWLTTELADKGWSAADTCLIVAAHGSGRSRNPSRDTHTFTEALQSRMGFGEVRVGFIEEPPVLVDMLADAGQQAICLPFFAARRGHVLEDLPEALVATGFTGLRLDPIGLHPDIPRLISDALVAACEDEVPA